MVQSPDPAFTAKEVGEEWGKTRQWGHNRLSDLEEKGLVNSKNPGGNARFYWITEDGKGYLRKSRNRQDGQ